MKCLGCLKAKKIIWQLELPQWTFWGQILVFYKVYFFAHTIIWPLMIRKFHRDLWCSKTISFFTRHRQENPLWAEWRSVNTRKGAFNQFAKRKKKIPCQKKWSILVSCVIIAKNGIHIQIILDLWVLQCSNETPCERNLIFREIISDLRSGCKGKWCVQFIGFARRKHFFVTPQELRNHFWGMWE